MKTTKLITIILSLIALAISFFPFLTEYSGGEESCTLIIRGFNLMEFSALGVIPILAPLLIPVILYGNQGKAAKERTLILLLLGNMLCYVHSFNAAKAWLENVGDSLISYYPTTIIYPVCFILVIILPKAIEVISSLKKEKV